MFNRFLIKKPLVSEKSTALAALGKYVFLVDGGATVSEVKKAVQSIYGVHIIGTNVLNIPGKLKRYGRYERMKAGYKKVIVTLKTGEKIDTVG